MRKSRNLLPLISRQLPHEPTQPVRPIDHIQMTDILQRALVSTPLGTLHTDQPIILTLYLLDDPVALTEHTPESGVYIGTVRVIGNTFTIGCFWVEVVSHVGLG